MTTRTTSRAMLSAAVVLAALALTTSCGDPPQNDTGADATDVADAADAGETGADAIDADAEGRDADATDGGDAGDGFTAPGILCESCTTDGDCGDSRDQCVELPDGENVCTTFCDPSKESPCPDHFQCANTDQDGSTGQCVPERLTCVDRCSSKNCPSGERCDPIDGMCKEPLGLCDTGCISDSMCGDGPDDQCLTVPGTTPTESMCATGCNPQKDSPGCPVDYQCVPLTEQENETDGVCFPIEGTCVDRCSDVSCPDGENCSRRTGSCVQAQYGACNKGCTNSAECGDQNDWCLNLGFSPETEAHCWIGCGGGAEQCPDNYRCQQLAGTTVNICIPESQRCTTCHGTSCFPGGACDPTSGMCKPLPKDCTKTGCPSGKLCDPRSTDCVEIGRSCSGGSWATDCDRVVTGCTTRVSGTSGTCEKICSSNSDCPSSESCVATNTRSFCLEDDLGGPGTCGTLRRSGTDVGANCTSDGDCGGSTTTCVNGGGITGFCSKSCSSDADCSGAQQCARGPSGTKICTPPQCRCAAGPGAGSTVRGALYSALQSVGLNLCEVWSDPTEALGIPSLAQTPLASERVGGLLEFPIAGIRDGAQIGTGAGASSGAPERALESAAATAGMDVSAQAGNYSFSGPNSKLTQASAELVRAAGGSPNISSLKSKAQSVPSAYQDVAAPIIMAVADAYRARDQALQSAGWGTSRRNQAFDGAPFLLLPDKSSVVSNAPDLSQSSVVSAYRKFPTEKMVEAGADLAATISSAKAAASNRTSWTGVNYVVQTPAGKIVLGGAGDTTYDPQANSSYGGDLAVVVDPAGDDTYRIAAGANTSVSNGVSVAVDLGGKDVYSYRKAGDSLDTQHLLTSDPDGRISRSGRGKGPVSISKTARQGAGRVGIGLLVDYGTVRDQYESLRMSQGSAVFGVGLLYDEGGRDEFDAEALSQGAALGGLGVVWSAGGGDDYRVWHAGQGFGAAGGTGILFDRRGDDSYEAVRGQNQNGVLYVSPVNKTVSNRNYAQGAAAGVTSSSNSVGLAGGLGVLRDGAGSDDYDADTYAQGYGAVRGVGILSEAGGRDSYDARSLVQGAGQYYGGGLLDERGGDDTYNQTVSAGTSGQGSAESYAWGALVERAGSDTYAYAAPGGGVGLDGGRGFLLEAGGKDNHQLGARAGWGFARNSARSGMPLYDVLTVGTFVDVGGASDTYNRPQISGSGIGNGKTWRQPDPATSVEKGIGTDQ